MAHGLSILDLTFIADSDLSSSQYFAVVKTNNAQGVDLAGDGAAILGILQNDPKQGQAAVVRVYGESQAICGDTVTEGAIVASDTNGAFKVAGSGKFGVGFALQPGAASDGSYASVLLLPQGKQ